MKTRKDEIIFLKAISNVLSDKYLLSHKLAKPISKDHLFIDKDFRLFQTDESIQNNLHLLTKKLKCSYHFSNGGLYQYLDLMIIDHPLLESRLIEFDEEQHFNFFRREALLGIKQWYKPDFWTKYISFCNDIDYQNRMLKKNRVKYHSGEIIGSFQEFQNIILKYSKEGNGYVEPKQDFPFLGGRIAQRAYFDTIRDIAEFDKRNSHLKSIIRFSKIDIERQYQRPFNKLSLNQIENYIDKELSRI